MALPSIMRRLFRNDGYGPLLKPEIIPFVSDLASRAADVAASTEWVKDFVEAEVFVSPNGDDDNNSGLTADSPFRSFAKAISQIKRLGRQTVTITVAGGTYSGDVNFDYVQCALKLTGSVTYNGSITFTATEALIYTSESNVTFTINGQFGITHGSCVNWYVATQVNYSGGEVAIFVSNNSYFYYTSSISVESTCDTALNVVSLGFCFGGDASSFTVTKRTSNPNTYGIRVSLNSVAIMSNITMARSVGSFPIRVASSSFMYITGDNTVRQNSAGTPLSALHNSTVIVGEGTLQIIGEQGTTSCVAVGYASNIFFLNLSLLNFYLYTGTRILEVLYNSYLMIGECSNTKMSGTATDAVVAAVENSYIELRNTTVGTDGCTGKRYAVANTSTINVHSAGANAFPGTVAGSAGSRSAYYY